MNALRVMPSAYEVERGLLRATPSLKALLGERCRIGEEEVVLDRDHYRVGLLYLRLGFKVGDILLFHRKPDGTVEVEVKPRAERSRPAPPPSEPKPHGGMPPAVQPQPQQGQKRVRLVFKEGSWVWEEPHPQTPPQDWPSPPPLSGAQKAPGPLQGPSGSLPPAPAQARGPNAASPPSSAANPFRVYALLKAKLGHEEFAWEGVEAYLEYRGIPPAEARRALERAGLLEPSPPFIRLKPRVGV